MDPIADFLTILRNGTMARLERVTAPYSRVKEDIARVLEKSGFVGDVTVTGEGVKKIIVVALRYLDKNLPAISGVKRVSKPSVRIYAKYNEIPRTMSGAGVTVVSTPKGVMTGAEASKSHLGGEIICQIW